MFIRFPLKACGNDIRGVWEWHIEAFGNDRPASVIQVPAFAGINSSGNLSLDEILSLGKLK